MHPNRSTQTNKPIEKPLTRGHLTLLFLLYFSQGLPFGFQATALPVYLRANGVSLTAIGFTGLLALPWALKPIFAPLVDRYFSKGIGKRKSWIIPMQAGLFLCTLAAAVVVKKADIPVLFASIFAMNFFAAVQDIAVDGLAVDLLSDRELGPGNAAQVIGYKAGMVVSGGLLVWLSGKTGWQGQFFIMAALILIPLAAATLFREPFTLSATASGQPKATLKAILTRALSAFRHPAMIRLVIFIATYKTGELMIDVMFKPFLVDSGFTPSQIGLWVGTYGMAASLSGSFAGGMLARKYPLRTMLTAALLCRMIPLFLEWALTIYSPQPIHVIGVTLAEHFFGGMLTTVVFAFMMASVDKTIGATHYTLLAGVEVLGKSPGAWISGPLADTMGYAPVFLTGIALSLVPLLIVPGLKAHSPSTSEAT